MKPAIKGFFFATLSAVLAAEIGFIIHDLILTWIYPSPIWTLNLDSLRILSVAAVYFLMFSVLSLVIFCIPLTAILSKYDFESGPAYVVAGFVVGMGVAFFFFTPMFEPYTFEILLFHFFCGAVPGAIAGMVWWQAYRSKRTAKSAA